MGGLTASEANPYHGGAGIHLHRGMFLGQLAEADLVNIMLPANESMTCLHDLFHVAQ
jgi:hypothetical protein